MKNAILLLILSVFILAANGQLTNAAFSRGYTHSGTRQLKVFQPRYTLNSSATGNRLYTEGIDSAYLKDSLIRKSKGLKGAGFFFLTIGTVTFSAGVLKVLTASTSVIIDPNGIKRHLKNTGAGLDIMLAGGLITLGSIPFFIGASHVKERANSITFTAGAQKNDAYTFNPALSPVIASAGIRIRLK